MKIGFDLHGNWCNEYPWISVMHNQDTVYQGYVQDRQVLQFDLTSTGHNHISILGMNKCNGINGKWDTEVDDQGRIVKDKNLLINDITVEGISMGTEWIKNLPMHTEQGTVQPCLLGMYTNGTIKFDIMEPVLSWIIEEKFIKYEHGPEFQSHERSGQARFEYDFVSDKIQTIKQLINDHNLDS